MAQAIRELKKRGAKTREINESIKICNQKIALLREQKQEIQDASIKTYTIVDLATGNSYEQKAKNQVIAISVFLAKQSGKDFQDEYPTLLSQFKNNSLAFEQMSKNYDIKEMICEELPSNEKLSLSTEIPVQNTEQL